MAYVPPYRLKLEAAAAAGSGDEAEQKLTWDALKKSLNGAVNKVNRANVKEILPELFQENLLRGRGLFARSVMRAQVSSPGFSPVYAALVAVVNTKLPEVGELVLKRVILQFRRAYRRNDKQVCSALVQFLAQLVNQQVAHEILALQMLTLLLEKPTDDSVELSVEFVKGVGAMLREVSPRGLDAIFERFRAILHEGDISMRVQYIIEGLFTARKKQFADHPSLPQELDLVEEEDRITHELGLEEELDADESCGAPPPDASACAAALCCCSVLLLCAAALAAALCCPPC